jgi:hypothetical protein
VKELYDPLGSNIRGRIMHGGLLDTLTKSVEAYLPIVYPSRYGAIALNRDAYSAENLCQLCYEVLQRLDAEARVTPTAQGWVSSFVLTPAELAEAQGLDWLLDDPDMVNRSGLLRDYLSAMAPLHSVPIKLGLSGLLGKHAVPHFEFPQFFCLVFVFELACRNVASVAGVEILQVSDQSKRRKVQYRMLDKLNLLSDDSGTKIFGYLPEKECERARKAVWLAARVRDAVAHGAFVTIADKTATISMHTVLTAVEYLVKAAMHHMTAKAAYHVWENERHREHGYDVIDWLLAEDEVRTRLGAEARRTV